MEICRAPDEANAVQFKTTDSEIHGVGGDDSWCARTHKKYTIDGNKTISFGLIIFNPLNYSNSINGICTVNL